MHRYPENNLFTLKKLIPIENKKGVFVKRFLFYLLSLSREIYLHLKLESFRRLLSNDLLFQIKCRFVIGKVIHYFINFAEM